MRLLVLVLAVVPCVVHADDAVHPRAAVVVLPADGLDAFVPAYLYEVGATVLRGRGYAVAPPNTAALRAVRAGHAAACLDDEPCFVALARSLGAPSLALVAPRLEEDGTLTARVVTGVVREGGLTARTDTTVTGDEGAVAEDLHARITALADEEPPCVVEVDAPEGLGVHLEVRGRPDGSEFPEFYRPGPLEVTVHAPNRAPWRGSVACAAGRRYRLTVR